MVYSPLCPVDAEKQLEAMRRAIGILGVIKHCVLPTPFNFNPTIMSCKDLSPPNIGFLKCEAWWRKHQPFLDNSDYQLRPKFDPSRKSPWKSNHEVYKSEERALHSVSDSVPSFSLDLLIK